jgi:hypothetical protein
MTILQLYSMNFNIENKNYDKIIIIIIVLYKRGYIL